MTPVRRAARALPGLAILAAASLGGAGAVDLTAAPAQASTVLAGSAPVTACSGTVAGITASAGTTPQVAKVGTAFATPLAVEVLDTTGCPVPDIGVTFELPTTGATAVFAGGANSITVTTATNGVATATALTANQTVGSYVATAVVDSFNVTFALANTSAGVASAVSEVSGNNQTTEIGDTFAEPLEVSVSDSFSDPVSAATVNFTVVTTAGAGATFAGGGASATAQTNESGIATSPVLMAGESAGAFTVTATVSGVNASVTFTLTDLSGRPTTIAAGVGTSQAAELGTDFAVPLAVTVTDTDGNPVVGATVTFRAPAGGASGVFAGSGTNAAVLTDSTGIAAAPEFSANQHTGGYVVTASVSGISIPATFALVNEPRSTASAPGPRARTGWLPAAAASSPQGTPPTMVP